MEYKLKVKDRLVLAGLLPPEGNLATMRIVHELRMAVGIDEAEFKDLQIHETEDGRLTWSQEQEAIAGPKSVEIGAKGQEIVRAALKKLDDDEKLAADHLDLCDLFEYEG